MQDDQEARLYLNASMIPDAAQSIQIIGLDLLSIRPYSFSRNAAFDMEVLLKDITKIELKRYSLYFHPDAR